jgi:hypothetical protein
MDGACSKHGEKQRERDYLEDASLDGRIVLTLNVPN